MLGCRLKDQASVSSTNHLSFNLTYAMSSKIQLLD